MKRKLFLTEKPDSAENLSFLLKKQDITILAQCIGGYKFNYINIDYSNTPYTKLNPLYKENVKFIHSIFNTNAFFQNKNRIEFPYLLEIINSKENKNKEDLKRKVEEFFINFDEIIFACDYDHIGWRGFEFKMTYFFKLGEKWINFFNSCDIKISIMKIFSYNKKSLKKSFMKRKNIQDSDCHLLKESYIKRDFFEYNYNLNSLLFFNKILKKIEIDNKNITLTKNYIATLFLLKEGKMLEKDLITFMREKKVGESSIFFEIIYNLRSLNLIKREGHFISISNKGKLFLSFLHKKSNDPYLNIRIIKDINELSLEDFKIKYEKYLYQLFSKQKCFLRKFDI